MKNKYPKGFQLGGVSWSIIRDDNKMNDHNAHGMCYSGKNKIYYTLTDDKDERNYDAIMETIWHELIHAILFNIGENDLSNNEKFVTGVANSVYQVIKTLK